QISLLATCHTIEHKGVPQVHQLTEADMNPTETEQDRQSFAETALRLGGKSEDEARRLGAVDRADEQVESLFALRFQTASSPVHKAVWEGKVPLELFAAPPLPESAPCDAAMERCLDVLRRRRA